ncbi:MAG: hypothetical protein KI792_09770 [Alphaproteobacteria bacterium]|nr:hypothetical protein [Alphaproteobacteria bacterium SS10]
MEAPFRYDTGEDQVEVSLYSEPPDEALSGRHDVEVVKPGEDYYGVSFDQLKEARRGVLSIDEERRSASISMVFAGRRTPDARTVLSPMRR